MWSDKYCMFSKYDKQKYKVVLISKGLSCYQIRSKRVNYIFCYSNFISSEIHRPIDLFDTTGPWLYDGLQAMYVFIVFSRNKDLNHSIY